MKCNDRFSMKDLFMNKELKGVFPQFTKKETMQKNINMEQIEKKVASYIKSVFNGRMSGGEIIIKGKYKEKFKQIKALVPTLESMFDNYSKITENIRNNARLITPFFSVEQLKAFEDPKKKLMAMQIVLDNILYNPEFQKNNQPVSNEYLKRQQKWLKSVGYYNLRRNIYG